MSFHLRTTLPDQTKSKGYKRVEWKWVCDHILIVHTYMCQIFKEYTLQIFLSVLLVELFVRMCVFM